MKAFAIALLTLLIVHQALHRHAFPRSSSQRTAEQAEAWAAAFARIRNGGLI